jgi:preprotein translocase subunit SecD
MKARNRLSLSFIVLLSALGLIISLATNSRPGLGLDLQGGASVSMKPIGEVREGALEQARSIIEQRVNGQGIGEAEVRVEGDRILVEVPGVKDPRKVLDLVGQTAELRFRPVLQQLPAGTNLFDPVPSSVAGSSVAGSSTKPGSTTKPASTTKAATSTVAPTTVADLGDAGFAVVAQADTSVAATTGATTQPGTTKPGTTQAGTTKPGTTKPGTTKAGTATTLPAAGTATTTVAPADPLQNVDKTTGLTDRAKDLPAETVVLEGIDGSRYVLGASLANGEIVDEAVAEIGQNGGWEVRLDLTGSGSGVFDSIAQQTLGRQLAIVLDSKVQSAPTINSANFGGTAIISGNFTESEAKDLASVLRYGALPVQLEQQQVQTVSASLGRDSLRAGILTGLLGLALVALYMLFYYRSLGLVVILGLCTSFGLLWSLLSFLTRTGGLALSLAGAVGIIVSVGVTVDSYVVYFERLRDEIRHGKSVDASIDRGFRRAWRTILAADGVSILGALVLYSLTVGSVRGFALMLMISTALDMVVAWFFTRPLVALLAEKKFFTSGRWGVASGAFGGIAPTATAAATAATGVIRPGSARINQEGPSK